MRARARGGERAAARPSLTPLSPPHRPRRVRSAKKGQIDEEHVWLGYDKRKLQARAAAIRAQSKEAADEGWEEDERAQALIRQLEAPLR